MSTENEHESNPDREYDSWAESEIIADLDHADAEIQRMRSDEKMRLRGVISRRFGKVYLEAERMFQVWRQERDYSALGSYLAKLRRCDRLQAMERRLA